MPSITIALVNPSKGSQGPFHRYIPPLGLLHLAAAVPDDDVYVYDGVISNGRVVALANEIRRIVPDIVGISVPFSTSSNAAIRLGLTLKSYLPSVLILGGGNHASFARSHLLDTGAFDLIIPGEGCDGFSTLVKTFKNGTRPLQQNYIDHWEHSRKKTKAKLNLPPPRWESLVEPFSIISYFPTIITSTGCKYSCPYCSTRSYWGHFRRRPLSEVYSDLETLPNRFGQMLLHILDDNFTQNRHFTFQVMKLLFERNIIWSCSCRLDDINQQFLYEMWCHGCRRLFVGVESGSERILSLYGGRKYSVKDAIALCGMAQKLNIEIVASFVVGFPEETIEDAHKTLQLIRKLPANNLGITSFTPFLGTSAYKRAIRTYPELAFSYNDMNINDNPRVGTKYMTLNEVRSYWYKAHRLVAARHLERYGERH